MQLLENIFGKKNNIKVLRHLAMHKDWQFNITELARDISVNKGILSKLVESLEKENIIKVSRKGKIKLFSINKDNQFIKDLVINLFEKEKNFQEEILRPLVKKIGNKAISIILYGSFASGKARLSSDIDVLVIASKKDNELEKDIALLKEEFLKKDLLLRIDMISIAELKNIYKMQEPFIKSVIKNNKVLHGKSLSEMIE